MYPKSSRDLILAVILASVLFFMMVGFIVSYIIIYRRKRQQHAYEMRIAREQYEKQLLQSQLEIQEYTFSHISREIHDNVGQILSLAKIQINIMNESDRYDRGMLGEVKQNVGKAMADLRDIAKSLNSERLRNTSILEAVVIESDRLNRSGVIQCSVSADGLEQDLSNKKKLILFRIIQECLQNVIKHAKALEVSIAFVFGDAGVTVHVRDNGVGFDSTHALADGQGLGLANMKVRAAMTGGSVAIDSKLTQGTITNIYIPYA